MVCNRDGNILQSTVSSYPYKLLFPNNHMENNYRCGIHFSNYRIEGKALSFFNYVFKILPSCASGYSNSNI